MNSSYYPKYNIVLINGNECISKSFICFLNTIYSLQENVKTAVTKNKELFLSCFNLVINENISEHTKLIDKQNIFCKLIFCFSLSGFSINSDIFNYINQKQLKFYIKLCLARLKKEKILYTLVQDRYIQSIGNNFFTINNAPVSSIVEILNIINFNFFKK